MKEEIKITVLGGGNVGLEITKRLSSCLFTATQQNEILSVKPRHIEVNVVTRDINKARAQTFDKFAADSVHGELFIKSHHQPNEESLSQADIIIFTLGKSAGKNNAVDRLQNIQYNLTLIESYAHAIKKNAPNALVLIISNPVELLTQHMKTVTGFDHHKVLGIGLEVDQLRYAHILSKQLANKGVHIEPGHIQTTAVGAHYEKGIIFLRKETFLNQTPIDKFLQQQNLNPSEIRKLIESAEEEARSAGMNHVRQNHGESAKYTPAAAVVKVIMAYLFNRKLDTSVAICANGELPFLGNQICMGLPVTICGSKVSIRDVDWANQQQRLLQVNKSLIERAEKEFEIFNTNQFINRQISDTSRRFGVFSKLTNARKSISTARTLYIKGYYRQSIELLQLQLIAQKNIRKQLKIHLDLGMAYNAIGNPELAYKELGRKRPSFTRALAAY